MELRPQEDNPQEQRHYTDTACFATHVPNKTKLKLDWLQGQARPCRSSSSPATFSERFGGLPPFLRPALSLNRLRSTFQAMNRNDLGGLFDLWPVAGKAAAGHELQ